MITWKTSARSYTYYVIRTIYCISQCNRPVSIFFILCTRTDMNAAIESTIVIKERPLFIQAITVHFFLHSSKEIIFVQVRCDVNHTYLSASNSFTSEKELFPVLEKPKPSVHRNVEFSKTDLDKSTLLAHIFNRMYSPYRSMFLLAS